MAKSGLKGILKRVTKSDKTDTEILGNGAEKIPKRDRKRIFIEHYCKSLNATQSAIAAGYSPKSARVYGSKFLADDNIRSQIDAILAERSRLNGIDADYIIGKLKEAVDAPKCPYKDRIKALELLGQTINMWSGENKNVPTEFTITLKKTGISNPPNLPCEQ